MLRSRAYQDKSWANRYVSARIGFERRWTGPRL
jgi:hypothetical protein